MTALRLAVATIAAGALLFACTALSGVGDLEATQDPVAENKDTGGSSASSSSSGAGGASSSTSSSSSSSSSSGADASSTSSSSSSSTSSSSSSSSGDAGGKTPTVFSDNFDRAASATVGNGWTEKTDHFSIQDNRLVNVSAVDDGYYNAVAWTPLAAGDVQVSYDVTFPVDSTTEADPTVIVRATAASVTTTNVYDGYTFYFLRNFAGIEREDAADAFLVLDSKAIDPPLDPSGTYHVTFQVTGTNPVTLTASVQDAKAQTLVTLTATDASAKRYANAGRVGIGSGTKGLGLKWDNFVETAK